MFIIVIITIIIEITKLLFCLINYFIEDLKRTGIFNILDFVLSCYYLLMVYVIT